MHAHYYKLMQLLLWGIAFRLLHAQHQEIEDVTVRIKKLHAGILLRPEMQYFMNNGYASIIDSLKYAMCVMNRKRASIPCQATP
jgi:hypothetical protein